MLPVGLSGPGPAACSLQAVGLASTHCFEGGAQGTPPPPSRAPTDLAAVGQRQVGLRQAVVAGLPRETHGRGHAWCG